MYILKIKGKAKIPDYIQLRDDEFTLIGYFRLDRPEKGLEKAGFEGERLNKVLKLIEKLEFGEIKEIDY